MIDNDPKTLLFSLGVRHMPTNIQPILAVYLQMTVLF